MIRNYFKTAWRNIVRNKAFSVIKILGLGIGLAVCMLIFLYTKDELSYDRFHKNKARIFRVIQTLQAGDNPPQTIGITTDIIGEAFSREIPEIQQYVRINGITVTLKKKNNDVITEQGMHVDDNFFKVFTFQINEGNKATAPTERLRTLPVFVCAGFQKPRRFWDGCLCHPRHQPERRVRDRAEASSQGGRAFRAGHLYDCE